jgi:hypothetical protein
MTKFRGQHHPPRVLDFTHEESESDTRRYRTWKAEDPAPKTNPSGKSRRVIAEALLGAMTTARSKTGSSRRVPCARSRRSTPKLLGGAMPLPTTGCCSPAPAARW